MKLPHFSISYGTHLNPVRDWTITLTIFGTLLLGSVGWNAWLFRDVVGGGVLGQAPTSLPAVFSQESLDAISKIFADRVSEEMKYKNGTHHFIDPSK